ncbi:MAG: serine/threonine protein kinase [Anaerolineae bacterium]|nr:MAG: serine/threonine protein kinase [Anaerolineae bacterium]
MATIFSNRYQVIETLGEGGMATVYKALDIRLEREVALKVIRRDLFAPDELAKILVRFEREAKSLARLSHPNIVKVLDFDEQDGVPYLVMEYVQGKTLKAVIAERGGRPFPWQEAFRLLIPVADALHHAHERHIIHRDVKPSNILINERGEPMLTDFGIAKALGGDGATQLTTTGTLIGTPDYMAPEQATNEGVDYRADIYSLGVVLYEMVTGHRPYSGNTPMTVLLKHVREPLPSPLQYVPDLPEPVVRLIMKALAKRPEDRYPSMAAFRAALEAGGESEEVGALPTVRADLAGETRRVSSELPPTVRVDVAPPRPKRFSLWTGLGIGAAIVCLLGVVGLALFWQPLMMTVFPPSPVPAPTIVVFVTETPLPPTATATAAPSPTWTPSPSPSVTPTSSSTNTVTPNTPMLLIDHNSFCRVGPGASYADVTDFAPGVTLPILATNNEGWWLVQIDLPWTKHKQCWIYGNTPLGNWTSVEIVTPTP